MDSNQSRFTVLNSEKDTIYISKNLLNEIARKNKQSKIGEETTGDNSPATNLQPAPEPERRPNVAPQVSAISQKAQSTFNSNDLIDMPVSLDPEYVAKHVDFEPSTNLYGIHGKYERKLQQYQHSWRSRWESLNSLNEKLFKLNSEKFANQVRKVEEKYFKDHITFEQPCGTNELRVINCLQLYGKKPLLCNEEVNKFVDCVQKARLDTLK